MKSISALLEFLKEGKIDNAVALTMAFRLQCLLNEYNKYPLITVDDQQEYVSFL